MNQLLHAQRVLEADARTIVHGHSFDVLPLLPSLRPQGTFDWRDPDDFAQPLTLTVTQQLATALTAVAQAALLPAVLALGDQVTVELRGVLEWGAGGAQHLAFFDFDRSTSLVVGGSWLRFAAIYQGFSALAAPDLPSVRVMATASEGAVGYLPKPRLTERAPAALTPFPAAGSSFIVAVPPFATSVRPVVPFPAGPGNVTLLQLDATGIPLSRTIWDDTTRLDEEELHNATRAIQIVNNYPVASVVAAAIFGLTL